MNGTKTDNGTKSRRMLVRGGLIVVYAALIGLSFVSGKGHTLLIDNKDSEDGSVKAFETVTVTVDNQDPMEFMANDRDQAKVTAQTHTIKVVVNGQTTERKIHLPIGESMLLLSVPKLVAGIEPSVTVFVPKEEAPAPEDNSGNGNAFTSPDPAATAAPAASGTQQAPPAP